MWEIFYACVHEYTWVSAFARVTACYHSCAAADIHVAQVLRAGRD